MTLHGHARAAGSRMGLAAPTHKFHLTSGDANISTSFPQAGPLPRLCSETSAVGRLRMPMGIALAQTCRTPVPVSEQCVVSTNGFQKAVSRHKPYWFACCCDKHWLYLEEVLNANAIECQKYDPNELPVDDDDNYIDDYVEDDSSFYDDCVREAREEEYGEIHDMRNEYATDNDSGWYE